MSEHKPKEIGGIFLLSGSCIGAGMLGLPVITAPAGFFPSLLMFFVAWLFMLATGLLLLEANLTVGHQFSLITLAEKTLGPLGKALCWFLFLFLFYSLGVAYISVSGNVFHDFCIEASGGRIPPWLGSAFFTLAFALLILIGTRSVDYINRFFMVLLFLSYAGLIFYGLPHIKGDYLSYRDWGVTLFTLPILVVSFGFHNMIPSLAHYYEGNRKKLRRVLMIGSALPLLIYLMWQIILLGILPLNGDQGLLDALQQGEPATSQLSRAVGCSFLNTVGQFFVLSAIVTSFLAQSLSLVDFLADGLKIEKKGWNKPFLILLALFPPFICAFLYPGLFLQALNWAGGFAAVLLFGCFPVLMVWKLRKQKKSQQPLLKGGNGMLLTIFLMSLFIFALETVHELGLSPLSVQSEERA